MYKLILDTATKNLYVCLIKDNLVIDERYICGKNDHAKNILTTIDDILNKEGIKVTMLDSIICGVGPGSYTGVRMSVTVGKMIACNSNVKLYGISSLYLMSSGYDGKVLSLIDARRGNSFCSSYVNDEIESEDLLRDTSLFIDSHKDYFIVDENNMKVNPLKVINKALVCNNPHGFVPNYLRETEAERNKNHD